MLRFALVLGISLLSCVPARAQWQFLDNGVVRVGVDLARGGAISWLSESGSSRNVVNVHDLGRYVQHSFYSGPDPYVPPGATQHPAYAGWGWNPVQAGDVFGFASTTLESSVDTTPGGEVLYVKSVPRQWALNGVDSACTLESWIHLEENRIHLRGRLVNDRSDTTRHSARHQELPAIYTIGELYRLYTYTGDDPWTGDALTRITNSGPPWEYWTSTEQWSALVDDDDWGLGVFHPGTLLTVGGFAGTPGFGGPSQFPTGYIAPLHTELIDHDIVYEYEVTLLLGTLQEIRDHAVRHRPRTGIRLVFDRDRQNCFPRNLHDEAPPYDGHWTLHLDQPGPQVHLPPVHWRAQDVPRLEIEAAFRTSDERAEIFFAGPDQAFSGDRRIEIPVIGDGQLRTYEVDLSQHPDYQGIITRLRFDPIMDAQAGDEVDLVSLGVPASTDAPPATPARPALVLESAHPNPFNPRTTLTWSTARGARVEIDVVDPAGRRVRRLEHGREVAPGTYHTVWDGRDDAGSPVASGVYHVRVRAGARVATGRVVLVR